MTTIQIPCNSNPHLNININNDLSKSNIKCITILNILLFFMCVLLYSSFVCIYAYANVYFKITIIKQNIKITLIAGVPSSQALPGFLITAPPSVCVSYVLGALAVWIQTQEKKEKQARAGWPRRLALVLVRATSRAEVDVIGVQRC